MEFKVGDRLISKHRSLFEILIISDIYIRLADVDTGVVVNIHPEALEKDIRLRKISRTNIDFKRFILGKTDRSLGISDVTKADLLRLVNIAVNNGQNEREKNLIIDLYKYIAEDLDLEKGR